MITYEQFKNKIAKSEFNCENFFGIPSHTAPPLLTELSFTRLLPVLAIPDHAQPVPSLPVSDSFATIASSNPNAATMPMLSSLESDQSLFSRLQTLLEASKVQPLSSDNSLFNYSSASECDKPSTSKIGCKKCSEFFDQNVELLDKNQELSDKFERSETEHYNTFVELQHAKDDKKELSLALSAIFSTCKNDLLTVSTIQTGSSKTRKSVKYFASENHPTETVTVQNAA